MCVYIDGLYFSLGINETFYNAILFIIIINKEVMNRTLQNLKKYYFEIFEELLSRAELDMYILFYQALVI